MAGDHQINHPADGIVVDSPVGSVNDGSVDDKKHPETIIYDVKATTTNEKVAATGSDGYTDAEVGEISADTGLQNDLQLVTKALETDDDPNENPYTFRAFVIGLGLSAFGAVIAEIFYFKPQTILVQTTFLIIIGYALGEATTLIPRVGVVGRFLNPGPFNQKEHVFLVIMASSAATSALGTEQLAAQALYYGEQPNAGSAIFMLFSSQCLGYGFLSMMRRSFVYPTKFTWPVILPQASLFQTMHFDKVLSHKRLRWFWVVCVGIMVWELVPQYMMPMTVGISIFCLAQQHSSTFTFLFGGTNGDEGLGFLSWSMDWQYIGTDPLIYPMHTLVNQLIGYCGCIALTIGAYYGNLWNAKTFPFMAQDLFLANGSVYNQTNILGDDNEVDPTKLASYGTPWFAMSNALSYLCMNMAVTAALVHCFLWHWSDLKFMFTWFTPSGIRHNIKSVSAGIDWKFWEQKGDGHVQDFPGTEGDPHFAHMRRYKEAPSFWYYSVLILALVVGLICCYQQRTGLPWWAFFIACAIGWFLTIPYACLYGITGFYYQPTTAIQMVGAYLVPRKPVANMMFTLYGSNALVQAILMLQDLKLAHYAKLPPRSTFIAQMTGTLVGAVLNWVMMNQIVTNEADILLSVEGTTIWSGQNVQSYNAQAVAWGGAGPEMFGRNGEYWMVPMGLFFGLFAPLPFWLVWKYVPKLRWMRMDRINTMIICNWLGWLSVGINSTLLAYFTWGFAAQWLRRYRPVLYAKWHLTVVAAIAGGCSIIVFILTFAVDGGTGVTRSFPSWWGNNLEGNADRCLYVN